MDPLLVFLGTIVFVSFIIPRFGPFLSLLIAAILYGLFTGMGAELMGYVVAGLGRIFSSLVIVVFAGAVIAEYLRKTGAIDRIVADLTGKRRRAQGGGAGRPGSAWRGRRRNSSSRNDPRKMPGMNGSTIRTPRAEASARKGLASHRSGLRSRSASRPSSSQSATARMKSPAATVITAPPPNQVARPSSSR